MRKYNKQQNLSSTWNSVVSLFFFAVKLYLENNKQEMIEENNSVFKKWIKGVIINE